MDNYVLFPFDKINKNSLVAIYGAGEIGINFKKQIEATNFCKIVCFIDKNADKINHIENIECTILDNLVNYEFDYLIIASMAYEKEIYKIILKSKVVDKRGIFLVEDKIISIENRYNINIYSNNNKYPSLDRINWNDYYDDSENLAEVQYDTFIAPMVKKYNLLYNNDSILDFACGHGRMADIFKKLCKNIICSDISSDAIEFCSNRFKGDTNVTCQTNEWNNIRLENNSIDFIYSWDAMVHFSYRLLDIYTGEFYRVLKNGGYMLIHHSNLSNCQQAKYKSDNYTENLGIRGNVSKEDYSYIAHKHGFKVIEQQVIDWKMRHVEQGIIDVIAKDLDCITILKKI